MTKEAEEQGEMVGSTGSDSKDKKDKEEEEREDFDILSKPCKVNERLRRAYHHPIL